MMGLVFSFSAFQSLFRKVKTEVLYGHFTHLPIVHICPIGSQLMWLTVTEYLYSWHPNPSAENHYILNII